MPEIFVHLFKPLNADFMEKYCQKPRQKTTIMGRPDKAIYDHRSHMVFYLAVMAALKVAFLAIYSNKSNDGVT